MSTNDKKKKEEKAKVAFLLAGIGLVIFFFLWRFVFSGTTTQTDIFQPIVVERRVPEIDFNYIKSEEFEKLENYRSVDSIDIEDLGRDNPFLPY